MAILEAMDLAERFAEAVLRHQYPKDTVTFAAFQAKGEHDFTIVFRSRGEACVEVASIVNPTEISSTKARHPNRTEGLGGRTLASMSLCGATERTGRGGCNWICGTGVPGPVSDISAPS